MSADLNQTTFIDATIEPRKGYLDLIDAYEKSDYFDDDTKLIEVKFSYCCRNKKELKNKILRYFSWKQSEQMAYGAVGKMSA